MCHLRHLRVCDVRRGVARKKVGIDLCCRGSERYRREAFGRNGGQQMIPQPCSMRRAGFVLGSQRRRLSGQSIVDTRPPEENDTNDPSQHATGR